ncbi:hypothetical protein [Kibdelosporangium aridum]|uniref:40-residue YVTN family beta-propeller repeat-containing protein n=1 Tax=Kibdelosporangium aridum TaxID=2030 RepID=A0A1W2CXJ4_KIBAR|nr:hypothetical protein [Kibdelosporangium aridum]SMC89622.1 hypothetical protein SAMN05661093_02573 [Kibdelosporangium aridum]
MRAIRGFGLAAVATLAVAGVAAFGDGNPVQDTRLLSGAAWLASGKVGQVTLLDGMTAEVSAQVQVAPSGNSLDVVQQGSTAYAVDKSAGTIRRIDGATFDVGPPATPIADASGDLTVIPGRTALYTVDNRRGILADTDPRTLQRRGEMISVADKLTAGTATVDDDGVFWSIDPATGKVAKVRDGQRSLHDVAEPGDSLITLTNGHPVVIDRKGARAISLSSTTASAIDTIQLDIRPDDVLRASGSPHNERLYVVHKRGVLTVCDLLESDCSKVIPLAGNSDFGAPVESGNRLFVPNYVTGEVWIIDLQRSAVVGKPKVLDTGAAFQLLTKDGVVFYNDLMSEKAGVIQLDGTVTPTAKYDAKNPSKGLTIPATGGPGTPPPANPATPSPGKPKPGTDNFTASATETEVRATWKENAQVALTVICGGHSTPGTITVHKGPAGHCASPNGDFVVYGYPGDKIELHAAPNLFPPPGYTYVFAGWEGGGCSGAHQACTVTLARTPVKVTGTFVTMETTG